HAGGDLHLDVHGDRLDPLERHGPDVRDHRIPLWQSPQARVAQPARAVQEHYVNTDFYTLRKPKPDRFTHRQRAWNMARTEPYKMGTWKARRRRPGAGGGGNPESMPTTWLRRRPRSAPRCRGRRSGEPRGCRSAR